MSEQPTERREPWKRELCTPFPGESWKPIPGWPRYEASDMGRLRWADSNRTVTQFLNSKGYFRVVLRSPNLRKEFRVHVLILLTFRGPRPFKLEGRHLDGNKTNNALTNLVYGTRLENEQDKVRHGTVAVGDSHGKSKLTVEQARIIKA